jgi:hypothetical protein
MRQTDRLEIWHQLDYQIREISCINQSASHKLHQPILGMYHQPNQLVQTTRYSDYQNQLSKHSPTRTTENYQQTTNMISSLAASSRSSASMMFGRLLSPQTARGFTSVASRSVVTTTQRATSSAFASCGIMIKPTTTSTHFRHMSTDATQEDKDKDLRHRLNNFQDLFVEARLCIEDVVESKGSVYFDDDAVAAKEATEEAIAEYDSLLASLDEEKRGEVQRGNGLKVAQLKAELELALEVDDH